MVTGPRPTYHYKKTQEGRPGRGSLPERSSAQRWRPALRWTSGSKRKKSIELGSPAAQERHEHEEHRGKVHWQLEAKEMALTSGGRMMR
jgi:hypothetical protein